MTATAVLASCADAGPAHSGPSSTTGPGARQLVGFRWLLTRIKTGGKSMPVPASSGATWQFGTDRQFLASDGVNAISGRYRPGPAGFTASNAGTTLVGYVGTDPVRLAVIAAFGAMTTQPVAVEPASAPDTAVMRVAHYVMTFHRDGPAVRFPPASPTSTASR